MKYLEETQVRIHIDAYMVFVSDTNVHESCILPFLPVILKF